MNIKYYDHKTGKVRDAFSPRQDETRSLMIGSGIKDAKGDEIFSGHIIAVPFENEGHILYSNHEVEFRNGAFTVESGFFNEELLKNCSPVEIVGNIHDDKELLKIVNRPYTGGLDV